MYLKQKKFGDKRVLLTTVMGRGGGSHEVENVNKYFLIHLTITELHHFKL
jgi:hypothetical protein